MTDTQTDDSHALDPALAMQLSRLAGLLGQAVPAHRFGMMGMTDSGLSLSAVLTPSGVIG